MTTSRSAQTARLSPETARLAVQKFCCVIHSAGFKVNQAEVDAVSWYCGVCLCFFYEWSVQGLGVKGHINISMPISTLMLSPPPPPPLLGETPGPAV